MPSYEYRQKWRERARRVRRSVGSVVYVTIFAYLTYHLFAGERGLVALYSLSHDRAAAQQELASLQLTREQMERRTRAMRPESLDLDLLDEESRRVLGSIHPNERIILLGKAQ